MTYAQRLLIHPFRVGDTLRCTALGWSYRTMMNVPHRPEAGVIYTVRSLDVGEKAEDWGVYLKEILNPRIDSVEPSFSVSKFERVP